VAASGRQLIALEQLFEPFKDEIAFVAENGGLVTYKDQLIYEARVTKQQIQDVYDVLLSNPHFQAGNMLSSGRNGAYILKEAAGDFGKFMEHYYVNVQYIDAWDEITDDIIKLSLNLPEDYVLEGEDWLNAHLDGMTGMTTGFQSIDVVPQGVDKGVGLQHLMETLGATAADLHAFGDNFNDYGMLELAAHSYATANARPQIKALSGQVIGHADDQAVLEQIEKELQM
jgi:Cof subfamily protein (haloacid dehalogenase superfamily)